MERSRPVRNRRHSRKTWPSDILHRPVKRLFTPEIKRMLKDWLVRRRDNPYPSRDEKKALAVETGLTYTQICNWFANWRRKLKNSGKQKTKKNWGNLIKNYNTSAHGNVEQFSICSSDSIWGENNGVDGDDTDSTYNSDSSVQKMFEIPKITRKRVKRVTTKSNRLKEKKKMFGVYKTPTASTLYNNFSNAFNPNSKPYFQISSTVDPNFDFKPQDSYVPTSKFKNHIIEKYLRGLDDASQNLPPASSYSFTTFIDSNNNHYNGRVDETTVLTGPQLSKWLESAANFTPSRENYIEWCAAAETTRRLENDRNFRPEEQGSALTLHQSEEIEAAEALTKLAINFRNKFGAAL